MNIEDKIDIFLNEGMKAHERTDAYVGTYTLEERRSDKVKKELQKLKEDIKAGRASKKYSWVKNQDFEFRWVPRGPREKSQSTWSMKDEREAYTRVPNATHFDVYITTTKRGYHPNR